MCDYPTNDPTCNGGANAVFVIAQALNANASVMYVDPGPGVPCSSLGTPAIPVSGGGGNFLQFALFQGRYCVPMLSQDSTYEAYVQASSLAIGGGAAWSPAFDVTQLDATQMSEAFAAGFVVVGIGFCMGKAISVLLRFFNL